MRQKQTTILWQKQKTSEKGGPSNILDDEIKKKPSSRVKKNHPTDLIIGKLDDVMVTKRRYINFVEYMCFVFLSEPKNVKEALLDEYWVKSMKKSWNCLLEMMCEL